MKNKNIWIIILGIILVGIGIFAVTSGPTDTAKTPTTGDIPQSEELSTEGNLVALQQALADSPYTISHVGIDDTSVKELSIYINEQDYTLNDSTFKRWVYTDEENNEYPAGLPIILNHGQRVIVNIINNTKAETNVHWHGLALPNDQDGPHLLIPANGGRYTYEFTPDYSGTYWYHSHNRPVRDQVDFGMYAPFIILDSTDKAYNKDQILVLDDWIVNRNTGHMQLEGDVDTVNGKTGGEIEPLYISSEDKVKLRFIQASTAKNTSLMFPFDILVTHTDGMPLEKPYATRELVLSPGERYDVEVIIHQPESQNFVIISERNAGIQIPVVYEYVENSKAVPVAQQGKTQKKRLIYQVKTLTLLI